MTGPQHYLEAERLTGEAAGVMNADYGLYTRMDTDERLRRLRALLAEAQVHATLALAAATITPNGLWELPASHAAGGWREVLAPISAKQ